MLSKPYVKPLPWCPVSIHASPAKGTVDATSSISHVLMYLDAPAERKNSHSDSVPIIPQLFNLTINSFNLLLGGSGENDCLPECNFPQIINHHKRSLVKICNKKRENDIDRKEGIYCVVNSQKGTTWILYKTKLKRGHPGRVANQHYQPGFPPPA